MSKLLIRFPLLMLLMMMASSAYAVDSYRYARVTIETPWAIFIFLMLIILFPFVLMAVLYWYFAGKNPDTKSNEYE